MLYLPYARVLRDVTLMGSAGVLHVDSGIRNTATLPLLEVWPVTARNFQNASDRYAGKSLRKPVDETHFLGQIAEAECDVVVLGMIIDAH
jgi:hypothetical protein